MMNEVLDTRGLSCPQPVLMVLSRLKVLKNGEIQVIVDNEVSRENVTRAAHTQGWEVQEERQGDECRLTLKR